MKISIRGAIFPLAILAFTAVGVRYWNLVFNSTTRWGFLAALLLAVITCGPSFNVFRTKLGFALGIYLVWCFATVAWSDVPQLSLMKSLALIVTTTTFLAAGYSWLHSWKHDSPLSFLFPLALLALFSGIGAHGATIDTGGIQIYQGLAGNPNYLGSLVAMGFPYVLWQVYRNKQNQIPYLLSLAAVATLLFELWLTASRSSLLAVLIISAMFLLTTNPGKRIVSFGLIAALGFGLAIAVPAVQDGIYQRLIVKNTETPNLETDIFISRRQVWEESLALAQQGGVFGAGYGVTIGDDSFSGDLSTFTAVGYGREKGNTQLAVWEETGIIGLVLYVGLLITIVLELGFSIPRMRERERRVELGLLYGTVIGFLVQSIFEAWWVAPGSAESAFFWATVGVAYGIVRSTVGQAHYRLAAEPSLASARA